MDKDITLNSDILVIDDSAVVLTVVKEILGSRYRVRTAQSAKEAYKKLEKKIPDLILLDLEMPEINGFDFLEKKLSTAAWKDIPVIFLTGIDDRKKEEKALELGAVEYILKPISEGILIKRVHFHLELLHFQKNMEALVQSRTQELLETQKGLVAAAETAKEALRVKSTFLANMSHEIRTPMNSIMGFSEIALDTEIAPETRGYLIKIKESTILLLRVINDILDISKIEAGKMEIECISFCPSNVVSNCQTMISQQINERGLKFTIILDDDLKDMQLLGDPVRLYQAVLNLLSNSAKFTRMGTVSLSALLISSDEKNAVVRFEVEDSGIGMTEEQLERAFEPFVQVDSETTRSIPGTGLGLPITKSIVELMGGKLTAESTLGVGSKFSIEIKFPITDSESLFDDVFGDSIPGSIERPHFEGEILVCEDNRLNQQVILEHLSRVGLECEIAENGLEGLKIVMERMKANKNPFDLILMDMQMPVMDGLEATARINALGIGTPIVALTANVMTTDLEKYRRSGLMYCIGKPFQTWDLWRCLLSFLMPVSKIHVNQKALNKSDVELWKRLQTSFPGENRGKIKRIKNAINDGDFKHARLLTHTLKSNAGLIKEHRLQELAATVEQMIEDGQIDDLGPHINHLESELKMVLDKLKPVSSRPIKASPEAQSEEKKQKSTDNKEATRENRKGILIVDDEKSNIIALTHFLREDYSVFVTRDSRDALEMAENHKPDIILLDIMMPEMDGYEVIKSLKKSKKSRDIPVVFISGLISPEAIKKGLSLGASDYITKPFEASTVKEKINNLLVNDQ